MRVIHRLKPSSRNRSKNYQPKTISLSITIKPTTNIKSSIIISGMKEQRKMCMRCKVMGSNKKMHDNTDEAHEELSNAGSMSTLAFAYGKKRKLTCFDHLFI